MLSKRRACFSGLVAAGCDVLAAFGHDAHQLCTSRLEEAGALIAIQLEDS